MGTELDFQKHFENSLLDIHKYQKYSNQKIKEEKPFIKELVKDFKKITETGIRAHI